MQILVLRCLAVDLAQETQPLNMPMTGFTAGDHRTIKSAQGGEQGGGAMAFVVMCHGFRPALLHRQSRLRSIQCLDLAFLITTQYQCMLRWVQIQTHDIFELVDKAGVPRDLESLQPMRFQTMGTPHPGPVSYTHLRAHETDSYLVCRLLLEKKKTTETTRITTLSY